MSRPVSPDIVGHWHKVGIKVKKKATHKILILSTNNLFAVRCI